MSEDTISDKAIEADIDRVSSEVAGSGPLISTSKKRQPKTERKKGAVATRANNADIETEFRRITTENEALTEIGQAVSNSEDDRELYSIFAKQLAMLVPFDIMWLCTVNAAIEQYTPVYCEGIEIEGVHLGVPLPLQGSPIGNVVAGRTGLVVDTGSEHDIYDEYPMLQPIFEAGMYSILSVPLLTRYRVVGAIQICASLPGFYTEKHVGTLERMVCQISSAMAHAQLHEERSQLQEQLIHSQKMEAIGRLAGGIAHDFNNLLTPIMGFAQIGLRGETAQPKSRTQFQKIYESSERATALVRQLLAFSRKEVIELKVMSLSKLVLDMDSILRRLIGENVDMVSRPKSDLAMSRFDPGQLGQVLVNLVVNARDAMIDGGRIIIETDDVDVTNRNANKHSGIPIGEYVKISVSDNGSGMPEDVRTRMFDPFFTTKDPGQGTGLGMSTSYGIVKQIGGYIVVESEEGQGTIITVYLPKTDELEDEAVEIFDETPFATGTETILVVEDEIAVREIAAYVLRDQGYHVLEASSGSEALSLLSGEIVPGIDLLLTDVVMPGMGGAELAKRLQESTPYARILYVSGYTDDTISNYGVIKDGSAFLQKPFTPEQLAQKVRDTIDA